MLVNDFELVFICREITAGMVNALKREDLPLIVIDREENFFHKLLAGDTVVLDGYQFGTSYQKIIRERGCKLVCIDDLHDREFVADLVINHVPGVSIDDYDAKPYTKFALGLDFCLLRPSFLREAANSRQSTKGNNIFICFGGSDPQNLTLKVLEAVIGYTEFSQILVVTGSAYTSPDLVEQFAMIYPRVKHYQNLDEGGIVELLRTCCLAIVPASGVLLEVLTVNIPVITGAYVANQKFFLREFAKLSQVHAIESFSHHNVTRAIDLILKKSVSIDKVIDGKSADRINVLFKELFDTVYIITGANRGLGNAFASLLMEKPNNKVVSISRKLAAEQSSLLGNGRFLFIEQDFARELDYASLRQIHALVHRGTRIVFINNAGTIDPLDRLTRISDAEIEASIRINVISPVLLVKFMLSEFPDHRIHFINISSGAANKSICNWSIYSASKAFVNRFNDIIETEVKEDGRCKFSTIDPGLVDTEMQQKIRSKNFPMRQTFEDAKREGKLRSPLDAARSIIQSLKIG